jgi:hypothetical protein
MASPFQFLQYGVFVHALDQQGLVSSFQAPADRHIGFGDAEFFRHTGDAFLIGPAVNGRRGETDSDGAVGPTAIRCRDVLGKTFMSIRVSMAQTKYLIVLLGDLIFELSNSI